MSTVNICDNTTITWQHNGRLFLLHIQRDEVANSPRENDNLAVMACWHRDYDLGDKLPDKDAEAYWQRMVRELVPRTDVIDAARNGKIYGIRTAPNPADSQLSDIYTNLPWETGGDRARECLEYEGVNARELYDCIVDELTPVQCQGLLYPYAVWLPLWLYDHSGLSISCGERNYPYNDQWDSGCLGWVFLSKATILNEMGADKDTWRERGLAVLRGEVEEYDQYLTGDVYGYTLYESEIPEAGEAPDWEETGDSCWGFYGSNIMQNGIVDYAGNGLGDAIRTGEYQTGVATLHKRYYYTFD